MPFHKILIIYELIFYGLHGLYAIASQFGHVPDAISTFQQRYNLLILLALLFGGLHAAFPPAQLTTAIDILLPPAIETVLDVAALDI